MGEDIKQIGMSDDELLKKWLSTFGKNVDKDRGSDVYIVAKDFSWTYVRTHEIEWCGLYLCKR